MWPSARPLPRPSRRRYPYISELFSAVAAVYCEYTPRTGAAVVGWLSLPATVLIGQVSFKIHAGSFAGLAPPHCFAPRAVLAKECRATARGRHPARAAYISNPLPALTLAFAACGASQRPRAVSTTSSPTAFRVPMR